MTLTRAAALFAFVLCTAPAAASADVIVDPFDKPHVRITEARLRQLFELGMSASPTFRALVERLEHSDVVVYVRTDTYGAPGVAGRLSFLSVAGGVRYLVIRLTPLRSAVQQLAMIGHELRHAVEVADRPGIVDAGSMEREYLQFGYENGASAAGRTVDTREAMEAEGLITDELRAAPMVAQPALLP